VVVSGHDKLEQSLYEKVHGQVTSSISVIFGAMLGAYAGVKFATSEQNRWFEIGFPAIIFCLTIFLISINIMTFNLDFDYKRNSKSFIFTAIVSAFATIGLWYFVFLEFLFILSMITLWAILHFCFINLIKGKLGQEKIMNFSKLT
jgi:hypothetical protein